jgi:hypothetical protein
MPRPTRPSGDRFLTAVLLLALGARLAVIAVLNRTGFSQPTNEHWQIATSLYRGHGFAFDWYGLFPQPVVGSFLPPLYPWVLAGLLFLARGSAHTAMVLSQFLNAMLGTATVWLCAALAEQTARSMRLPRGAGPVPRDAMAEEPAVPGAGATARAGRGRPARTATILRRLSPGHLAAAAWALYPPALGHAAQSQSTVIETFLLMLLLVLVLIGLERMGKSSGAVDQACAEPLARQLAPAIAAGIVFGLCLLVRPTLGITWTLWIAAGLLSAGFTARRARGPAGQTATPPPGRHRLGWSCSPAPLAVLRFYAVATLMATAVILPWTARNITVHGRLVPVATNGGFNFYMGNNPIWEGGIPPLVLYFPRMTEEDRVAWRALSETERDRAFFRMGIDYWRDQPGRAFRGAAHRLVSFALWRPYLFAAYPRWLAVIFIASYLAILGPFLLALPRCRGPACVLPLLAILATGLAGLAFIVSMRFRATVEPLLVTLGAGHARPNPDPARGSARAPL